MLNRIDVGNDSVNFVDPDGLKFIYIIDSKAVGGHGHAAVITGQPGREFRYDSYGANKGDHRHGQYTFSSEAEAMKWARDEGYTHFASWDTTAEQDTRARAAADGWHSGFGTSYQPKNKYLATGNNCQSMINDMAHKADIESWVAPSRHPVMTYGKLRGQANSSGSIK